ncbi:MAG: right-handed parallel beta-helix repeat-containing protein [Candidatus Bathyarchaeota archaeon]|nr:MAG: right-handed parallel beta-helix repeat-containing protein [Candidatus Bathyarchaeota archaeon]
MILETKATLLVLLIFCVLLLSIPNIGLVKAEGTIYIRSDGAVEGTDKIQRNGEIYVLTGNISAGIQVQKSNIVLDGAGYTVQGNGVENQRGIDLSNDRGSDLSRPKISNVTVKDMRIVNFSCGVAHVNTANNTIIGNYIADCFIGINVMGSPNDFLIKNNTFVNNVNPISIAYSGGVQVITENSFIDGNFIIVWLSPEPDVDRNYWSDYNGTDADGNGIGDSPYVYGGHQESKYIDKHPLVEPVPVIAEFPSWTIVLPLVIAVMLDAVAYRRELSKSNKRGMGLTEITGTNIQVTTLTATE